MFIGTLFSCLYILGGSLRTGPRFLNVKSSLNSNGKLCHQLNARASKVEGKDQQSGLPDQLTEIPFNGILGADSGSLFNQPLEINEPSKELLDVPGEDGSEEQIKAIQRKVQERIERLKEKSADNRLDQQEFGEDPLQNMPLWQIMFMQAKAARPFDDWTEFGLIYILVFIGGGLLTGYLYIIQIGLDSFIEYFEKTDFDAEYIRSLNPFR
jgi:hypothetical protein